MAKLVKAPATSLMTRVQSLGLIQSLRKEPVPLKCLLVPLACAGAGV